MSGSDSSFLYLAVAVGLGAVGTAAYYAFRGRSGPTRRDGFRGGSASAGNIRAVADGFWLHDSSIARGTTLRYRCNVSGRRKDGMARYEPGRDGLFVYTGGTPSEIVVDGVGGGSDGTDYDYDGPDSSPVSSSPISTSPVSTGVSAGVVNTGIGVVTDALVGSSGSSSDDVSEPFRGFPSAY